MAPPTSVPPSDSSSGQPRLFTFDQSDPALSLLPLASRRALDQAGIKLSLQAYQKLSVQKRFDLAYLGSQEKIDLARVREIALSVDSELQSIRPAHDPPSLQAAEGLLSALGPTRPLPQKVWQGLSAIERYALAKVATRSNEDRLNACYRELIGDQALSTHLRPQGGVHMVSVSGKIPSQRRARAEAWVTMSTGAYARLKQADIPKGDVLGTARLAAIMATKKTAELIPLCHPLPLQHVDVELELVDARSALRIECRVDVFGPTGVEMEALSGASVGALTIYDMLKSIDRSMVIGPIQLLEKEGGQSGHFLRSTGEE